MCCCNSPTISFYFAPLLRKWSHWSSLSPSELPFVPFLCAAFDSVKFGYWIASNFKPILKREKRIKIRRRYRCINKWNRFDSGLILKFNVKANSIHSWTMQLKSQNRTASNRMAEKIWNNTIYQLSGIVECLKCGSAVFSFSFARSTLITETSMNWHNMNILAVPNQSFLWVSWTYWVIFSLFSIRSFFKFIIAHDDCCLNVFCVLLLLLLLCNWWAYGILRLAHFNALKFLQRHRVYCAEVIAKGRGKTVRDTSTEPKQNSKQQKQKHFTEETIKYEFQMGKRNVIGWPWPMDWNMMTVAMMMTMIVIDFGLRCFENHTCAAYATWPWCQLFPLVPTINLNGMEISFERKCGTEMNGHNNVMAPGCWWRPQPWTARAAKLFR